MRAIQIFTAIAAGLLLGWAISTRSIADDCERLGSFYDGRNIHHCTSESLKDEKNQ
jgi:hypothetical protein